MQLPIALDCSSLVVCCRRLASTTSQGNTEVDGEIQKTVVGKKTYFVNEVEEDRRPFRAYLDVGCRATTTGCRIFGALKGASDGGLDIPHNEKRFPGYDRDSKQYDADMHKERIFGGHVGEYMEYLEEEDNQKYQEQFASYIANDLSADGLEELYETVHTAIREDPSPSEKQDFTPDKSYKKKPKLTLDERKANIQAKKDARVKDDDDE